MLFSLVKKDLVLSKKYLIFIVLFTIIAPIFIYSKAGELNFKGLEFFSFFITVLLSEYMLFNTVSMMEYKYGGAILLCTTPYTRSSLVKSKYLFILAIFILVYVVYTITTFISPIKINNINIFELGLSLLIILILFGIMIPIQYKFGYEKTRYLSFGFIFIFPFIMPSILTTDMFKNIDLKFIYMLPEIIKNLSMYIIALLIGFISMKFSLTIYSKKDF